MKSLEKQKNANDLVCRVQWSITGSYEDLGGNE